ncbi:MAG: AAA family ATPase, partial [Lachnospiraceae bacterium]|nr:AAA family ATPase [Lachnospiraceae bacterium]
MSKRLDVNECEDLVESSKNVIFHGAPGTGKTYLAKQIAAKIVSNDCCDQYDKLENLQNQVGFIQFYPGYDYSNFVEGWKPSTENGDMKFLLTPGIFKIFVSNARKKLEEYKTFLKKVSSDKRQAVIERLMQCVESNYPFWTYRTNPSRGQNNKFHIDGLNLEVKDPTITIASESVEGGEVPLKLSQLLEGPGDKNNFGINEEKNTRNLPSYYRPIWDFLFNPPKFVFIIDEINRGSTSGIFGELFYAIDPNNRGKKGEVTLQYSGKKFYIPENVLIIGTMNDIDRSVEPFDFAFRRRWTSKLIEPTETQDGILSSFKGDLKDDIINCMNNLNAKIRETDGLGADYQIGAAYFLKLKDLGNDFDKLWK